MKNNLKKSFLANSFGTLVTIFDRLLIVPFLFSVLSPSAANAWMVIRTIPSYIGSADVGMSSEAGNRMTAAVSGDNYMLAKSIYSTTFYLVAAFGFFVLFAFVLWAYFFGGEWINENIEYDEVKSLGILIFVAMYALQINQSQILNAIFRSVSLDYKGVLFTHCIRVFEILLFCTSVYFFEDLFFGALSYFSARLLGNLCMNYYKNKKISWARVELAAFSSNIALSMIRPALSFAAFPLIVGLYQQIPISVLAAKFNVNVAGNISILLVFSRFLSQYGLQMARTVWPELTRISSSGGASSNFWLLHDKAVGLVFVGGGGLFLLFLFVGEYFIYNWTVGNFSPEFKHLFLALLAMYLNSVWHSSYSAWQARSLHGSIVGKFAKIFSIYLICCTLIYFFDVGVSESVTAILITSVFFELIMVWLVFRGAALERNSSVINLIKGAIWVAVIFLKDKFFRTKG